MDGLKYLTSLGYSTIRPGLERIEELLSYLGNPQRGLRTILIGGTNGKGSVASAVSSVLREAGYRTGLYTSPHLSDVTERIRVDGENIASEELSSIALDVKGVCESKGVETTYFEALTVAAFTHFERRRVEFAVLEVGMGGRWDATNLIEPLVSVITNVTIDHRRFLGDSVPAIAWEKAGIIKPGVPVVTGARGEALGVISKRARGLSAPLIAAGEHFSVNGNDTSNFSYKGAGWRLENIKFGLRGCYQLENAATAIAALEILSSRRVGVRVGEDALRAGLLKTRWEGRMEILSDAPPIVLDAAHNPAGAAALADSLRTIYPNERFSFLLSISKEKDQSGILSALRGVASGLIITDVDSSPVLPASELAHIARGLYDDVEVAGDWKLGLKTALAYRAPLCIAGSIYLVGTVRPVLKAELCDE